MAARNNIKLVGTITAESPVAVSPHGSGWPQGFRTAPNYASNSKNIAFMPRMDAILDGAPVNVPYIPGGTIRGSFRRGATVSIVDRFRSVGKDIDYASYLQWVVGGVKSSGDEKITLDVRNATIAANPMLSLYGAGDSAAGFVGSKASIGHAIPGQEIKPTLITGVRTGEHRNPELPKVLSPDEMDKVREMTEANTTRSRLSKEVDAIRKNVKKLAKEVKDGKRPANDTDVTEANEDLAKVEKQLKVATEVANQNGGDVSLLMPLPGYECLPQGAVLDHKLQLTGTTNNETGLFLDGLANFAIDPRVGAHKAHGLGEISGHYDVYVLNGRKWERDGELSFAPLTGLEFTSDTLTNAFEAWTNSDVELGGLLMNPELKAAVG